MPKRYATIWFRSLKTDLHSRRQPGLWNVPFVLTTPEHSRMMVTAANDPARMEGIDAGMALADARVIIPTIEVFDDQPGIAGKALALMAEWCIRYTPIVALDAPDGLILDITGCAHLWNNEMDYMKDILHRFKNIGYQVRISIADTIGTAWAVTHYGKNGSIIERDMQFFALLPLPPEALRLNDESVQKLHKLGLKRIGDFLKMSRSALRRRFGDEILLRIDEALGHKEEVILPIQPEEDYREQLSCFEPIVTLTGVEIALQQLLDTICKRLRKEEKGCRIVVLTCFCIDGGFRKVEIGTNRAASNSQHLFKLFELKLPDIIIDSGIEVFLVEAKRVEVIVPVQEKMWQKNASFDDVHLLELIDRLTSKFGAGHIQRFIPAEHYWPEKSFKIAESVYEEVATSWKTDKPRPLKLLETPEPIEVTAPIPDYPPMLFRYRNKLHKIKKADGPERIEREWWLQEGQHRDYYLVEDENGLRYWLFRLGHYDSEKSYGWFIHGFFA